MSDLSNRFVPAKTMQSNAYSLKYSCFFVTQQKKKHTYVDQSRGHKAAGKRRRGGGRGVGEKTGTHLARFRVHINYQLAVQNRLPQRRPVDVALLRADLSSVGEPEAFNLTVLFFSIDLFAPLTVIAKSKRPTRRPQSQLTGTCAERTDKATQRDKGGNGETDEKDVLLVRHPVPSNQDQHPNPIRLLTHPEADESDA